MSSTAGDRFRRLLEILPRIADATDAPVAELATSLGVEPRVLLADLRALAERYDEPGGFVAGVSVLLEGDRVSVRANHFHRPMRLSISELCALEVGLGVLAREQGADAVGTLRGKLAQVIAKLPSDEAHTGLRDGALADGGQVAVLPTLREAMRQSRVVVMTYRKGFGDAASEREVHPHRLVFARGVWYLVGWCARSDGPRVFRADRIVALSVTDAPITRALAEDEVPTLDDGTPFSPPAGVAAMTVRYLPAIARWIVERDGGTVEADGSAVRTIPLADREWALRHVLQYGPDAVILDPPELREELVARLRALAVAE
jgi:predicted DNA-binding transcriptional regulator YafY